MDNLSSPLTHIEAVEQDWLESGISPDLIRLNREAVKEVVSRQLQGWIEKFADSFRDGRLKRVLSDSVWFCRQPCKASFEERQIAGIVVEIRPQDRETCKYLISKLKTLRYRLKRLDPEVKLLLLSNPHGEKALGIIIETGEIVLASLPVEVRGGLQ